LEEEELKSGELRRNVALMRVIEETQSRRYLMKKRLPGEATEANVIVYRYDSLISGADDEARTDLEIIERMDVMEGFARRKRELIREMLMLRSNEKRMEAEEDEKLNGDELKFIDGRDVWNIVRIVNRFPGIDEEMILKMLNRSGLGWSKRDLRELIDNEFEILETWNGSLFLRDGENSLRRVLRTQEEYKRAANESKVDVEVLSRDLRETKEDLRMVVGEMYEALDMEMSEEEDEQIVIPTRNRMRSNESKIFEGSVSFLERKRMRKTVLGREVEIMVNENVVNRSLRGEFLCIDLEWDENNVMTYYLVLSVFRDKDEMKMRINVIEPERILNSEVSMRAMNNSIVQKYGWGNNTDHVVFKDVFGINMQGVVDVQKIVAMRTGRIEKLENMHCKLKGTVARGKDKSVFIRGEERMLSDCEDLVMLFEVCVSVLMCDDPMANVRLLDSNALLCGSWSIEEMRDFLMRVGIKFSLEISEMMIMGKIDEGDGKLRVKVTLEDQKTNEVLSERVRILDGESFEPLEIQREMLEREIKNMGNEVLLGASNGWPRDPMDACVVLNKLKKGEISQRYDFEKGSKFLVWETGRESYYLGEDADEMMNNLSNWRKRSEYIKAEWGWSLMWINVDRLKRSGMAYCKAVVERDVKESMRSMVRMSSDMKRCLTEIEVNLMTVGEVRRLMMVVLATSLFDALSNRGNWRISSLSEEEEGTFIRVERGVRKYMVRFLRDEKMIEREIADESEMKSWRERNGISERVGEERMRELLMCAVRCERWEGTFYSRVNREGSEEIMRPDVVCIRVIKKIIVELKGSWLMNDRVKRVSDFLNGDHSMYKRVRLCHELWRVGSRLEEYFREQEERERVDSMFYDRVVKRRVSNAVAEVRGIEERSWKVSSRGSIYDLTQAELKELLKDESILRIGFKLMG
jgi:hypothetical protein